MIHTLAVSNYRSLRDIVVPLEPLTVVTGPNGSGKSNLYRALRLLGETALGTATASLAREGGVNSVLWAGPETFAKAVRRGEQRVQGGPRRKPVAVKLGFASDDFSYAIEFGVAGKSVSDPSRPSAFSHDPEIKREAIWHGNKWRSGAALADRRGPQARSRDDDGAWRTASNGLATCDSMLTQIADPASAPEVLLVRERIRSWRFYDGFRTDALAPARQSQIGTLTPVLDHDGRDLAAALQTIREIGDHEALESAIEDAFPGATLTVQWHGGVFDVDFNQHGLLRPLGQAELSDGTLRYLLWVAALLTPRPPELMVVNEPETSLHPDLIPALARLIVQASEATQVWVVTHSSALVTHLQDAADCYLVELGKELGETCIAGQSLLDKPTWQWPSR